MRLSFKRCDDVTHSLLVMWWDCPSTKCATSLTSCWSQKWDCLSQSVQCHSQTVSHRKEHHETTFHKMCNVTHILFIIRKDLMTLQFTKCAMSLTGCWSYVGKDVMGLPFIKCALSLTFCWVIIEKDVMGLPFIKCALSLTFKSCSLQEKMWWYHCLLLKLGVAMPSQQRRTLHYKCNTYRVWCI